MSGSHSLAQIARAAEWSAKAYSTSTFSVGAATGIIAADGDGVVLAFRGSSSITDWLADLSFVPQKKRFGHVHGGFWEALSGAWYEICRQLAATAKKQACPVLITGHSLGGALACLAARSIAGAIGLGYCQVEAITFGQPRVGDAEYARTYATPLTRVMNARDIVPWVPGRLLPFLCFTPVLYTHCGNPILLLEDGTIQDPPSHLELAHDCVDSWLPGSIKTCASHHVIAEYQRRLRLAGAYADTPPAKAA